MFDIYFILVLTITTIETAANSSAYLLPSWPTSLDEHQHCPLYLKASSFINNKVIWSIHMQYLPASLISKLIILDSLLDSAPPACRLYIFVYKSEQLKISVCHTHHFYWSSFNVHVPQLTAIPTREGDKGEKAMKNSSFFCCSFLSRSRNVDKIVQGTTYLNYRLHHP